MDPMLYNVPVEIETERLRLHVPGAGDGERVYSSVRFSIEELKQWMPWATDAYTAEDAEIWCRRSFVEFHARRSMQMLVLQKDADAHIGNVGAMDFDLTVKSCEIGYWLRTDQIGHGYMTEAVKALGDLMAAVLRMHRIRIRCDARNGRSAAVARRCFYSLEGTSRHDSLDVAGGYRDTHVFSRLFDSA